MPSLKRRTVNALVLSVLYLASGPIAATEVVTSIKPLELLVRAVAGDTAEITTLVPAGSSPHTYTMRPSQRRALERANAIFWVGPTMESFLSRLLAGEDFHDRTVMLAPGDHEGPSGHHHEMPNSDEQDAPHNHGDGDDPHLWLDPSLALEMARTIHDTLVRLEGADVKALDHNLEMFETRLAAAEQDLRSKLGATEDLDLFAYHSAFSRFAEHYELPLTGVLTLNPALSPGARHISEVQRQLRAANHACLLTEPQFNRQWWQTITRDIDVTFSVWDPLASDIEANTNGYVAFLQSIADAVLRCLPENAKH